MKFSTLYLEIGRYWERLHRISAVARFYLPNCMILLLQKSSLVRSWSVHQSVKHRKARMTTRAWKWPHKVYVTPSVTGFFRRVFLCALLSSHARITSQRGLVCQSVIKQWVLDHEFSLFFFFALFSPGKRWPLMMERSSALWACTGESTLEKDRTRRLLKLQPPSLLLKDWKRNLQKRTPRYILGSSQNHISIRLESENSTNYLQVFQWKSINVPVIKPSKHSVGQ